MTKTTHWGGIPPDNDHLDLIMCCYPRCEVKATDEPLIVTGFTGKMRTFCRRHLDQLARQHWQGTP